MSDIEKALYHKFLELVRPHHNGRWATNELEYLIFTKHKDLFYSLPIDKQEEVRMYLVCLRKIYGQKQYGDL